METRAVRRWLGSWVLVTAGSLPLAWGQETTRPDVPAETRPPAATSGSGGTMGQVVSAPYSPPVDPGCAGLASEIAALDGILGADLDAAAATGRRGRSLAAKSLTQAAHSLVPYRSWVRKLSGAEKRDERLAAAIITGTTRRAYLKGLGSARGCAPPASPLPEPLPAAAATGSPTPPEAEPTTAEDQRPPKR
jgi:hypothetical protein